MAEIIISILQLASLWVLAAIFLGSEYLDWFGRLEVLETKHPKIHRFVIARPLRLVLLLLIFGLLAENTKDTIRQLEGEQNIPVIRFAAPQVPAVREATPPFVEPENSLRRRTLAIADQVVDYLQRREDERQQRQIAVAVPDSRNPNPSDDQKKQIEAYREFETTTVRYYQEHFLPKILDVLRDYKQRGVDVGFLENDASQNMMYIFLPNGQRLGCSGTALCNFRELAYHVDAYDNRMDIP